MDKQKIQVEFLLSVNMVLVIQMSIILWMQGVVVVYNYQEMLIQAHLE